MKESKTAPTAKSPTSQKATTISTKNSRKNSLTRLRTSRGHVKSLTLMGSGLYFFMKFLINYVFHKCYPVISININFNPVTILGLVGIFASNLLSMLIPANFLYKKFVSTNPFYFFQTLSTFYLIVYGPGILYIIDSIKILFL